MKAHGKLRALNNGSLNEKTLNATFICGFSTRGVETDERAVNPKAFESQRTPRSTGGPPGPERCAIHCPLL